MSPKINAISVILIVCSTSSAYAKAHADEYGKPCNRDPNISLASAQCSSDKNMECSEKGICECIVGERGRIFSHFHKRCIEIGSPENGFACTEDVQCTLSSLGRYSKCDRTTDVCICSDANANTERKGNVCYIKNPRQGRSGRAVGGLQGCQGDNDCQNSVLGSLSRCNQLSNTCECYDTRQSGKQETTLYEGRCIYPKPLGGYCDEDIQCQAGHHKNAVCANHPSYLPKEKICQCLQQERCDASGASTNYKSETKSVFVIGVTTVIMGILATKVFS